MIMIASEGRRMIPTLIGWTKNNCKRRFIHCLYQGRTSSSLPLLSSSTSSFESQSLLYRIVPSNHNHGSCDATRISLPYLPGRRRRHGHCRQLSTTKTSTNTDDSLYDKYRGPITPELWNEFSVESAFTKQHAVDQNLYMEIQSEVEELMTQLWDRHDVVVPPELGPTGQWEYRMVLIKDGGANHHQRIYERYATTTTTRQQNNRPRQVRKGESTTGIIEDCDGEYITDSEDQTSSSSSSSSSPLPRPPQIVLTIEPQEEILAMSLTPDETCIAWLVHDHHTNNNGQSGGCCNHFEVRVRNIQSGRQIVLPMIDHRDNDDGNYYHQKTNIDIDDESMSSTVISLEWGPSPAKNLSDSDSPTTHQSLYLLFANNQGRPHQVAVMTVHSDTLIPVITKEGGHITSVYQNDDPAVMVDVQRTKGCSYVAIKATTKTSNEIYLVGGVGWYHPPSLLSLPHHLGGCDTLNPKNSYNSTGIVPKPPALILVKQRQQGVLYHVDVGVHDDVILLMSEDGGDYTVMETEIGALPLPLDATNMTTTTTTTMTGPSANNDTRNVFLSKNRNGHHYCIEDMDLFRSYLVLYERSMTTGEPRVRVRRRRRRRIIKGPGCDGEVVDNERNETPDRLDEEEDDDHVIDLSRPTVGMSWNKLSPVGNICYEADSLRIELESPATPGTMYEYHFDSRQLTKLHGSIGRSTIQKEDGEVTATGVPAVDDNEQFADEKIFVKSIDGTNIPMTLVYRAKGGSRDDGVVSITDQENRMVVLVGYGAYGEPMNLGYDPGWVPLLRRGVVLAFAHTRGMGDLGKAWYAQGRRENKLRAIEDFEACAQYLKSQMKGISLSAKAFSAGGVVIGATTNRNPNLFDKVVLTNAFLDVFVTMSTPSLFLTEHEYDEFGDPSLDAEEASLIASYCPIRNIRADRHTVTKFLITCTMDDPNVPYWNSTLFFKKLLEDGISGHDELDGQSSFRRKCYLNIEKEGGHNLTGPTKISTVSLENAFLLGEKNF